MIYFNSTEANLEQFRMNNQHYKTERRSSKLYYTEISSFPHGNLRIIDSYEINEMANTLDFKDFLILIFIIFGLMNNRKLKLRLKMRLEKTKIFQLV